MRKTRPRHGWLIRGLPVVWVPFLAIGTAAAPADGVGKSSVPTEASELGVTPVEWESLTKGKVVVRGAAGKNGADARAAAFVLVGAPWTAAFSFVGDHTRAPEYSRCTKSVEIVARESRDGRELVKSRETHKALWITMRYTVDFVHDPAAREIRWALDPTAHNDVKDNSGAWRFVPLPGNRTLVAYRVSGIPGRLPRFMLDLFVRKDLPRYLAELRRLVEAAAVAPAPAAQVKREAAEA